MASDIPYNLMSEDMNTHKKKVIDRSNENASLSIRQDK